MYMARAESEKVLVENDGVFELVNASEVLCLDPGGRLDAKITPQGSPTESGPAQIDLKLDDGFQPPIEAAQFDLNHNSYLPPGEEGPVEVDLKLEDSLLTPSGAGPAQIDLNLKGAPNEAEPVQTDLKLEDSSQPQISSQPPKEAGLAQISSQAPKEAGSAQIDLNLDCSEIGSTKKGVSSTAPSNYLNMKLEPMIQFDAAKHKQQRPLIQNKSPPGLTGAEDVGKRKMNDAAFLVWLASKKELRAAKQKAAENAERVSREERERRAGQSKIAFEIWLARKNQQDTIKKTPSPVSRSAHQSFCPSAFETWTRKKREEHVKKVQIENERLEREEEAAKRVDHNIASKAFSRWLHHKTVRTKVAPEQHIKLCSQKNRTLKNISITRHRSLQQLVNRVLANARGGAVSELVTFTAASDIFRNSIKC